MLHEGTRVKLERSALFVGMEMIYQTAQHHIRDDKKYSYYLPPQYIRNVTHYSRV
jgi:hypothetical protein